VLQLVALLILILLPAPSHAQIKFNPQVSIPNSNFTHSDTPGSGITIQPTSIGEYIRSIYRYAIGIVGILATVVLMFGGFRWLTAGGNASTISEAQEWIKAALTGLVLTFSAYLILATVNPALINLAPINAPGINKKDVQTATVNCSGKVLNDCTGACIWNNGNCIIDPNQAGQPCTTNNNKPGTYVDLEGIGLACQPN